MTQDQLAALISFGVPAILMFFFLIGHRLGVKKASRVMGVRLQEERAARIQRWTPPAPQQGGDPGTPERLLSDYEDAIYTESRHAAVAQYGDADEQHHVAVAAQLHADVRRLRGHVLATILATSGSARQPGDDPG